MLQEQKYFCSITIRTDVLNVNVKGLDAMQHMNKAETIKAITAMMKETDDEVLLAFIYKMLQKASLHQAS